MRRLLDWLFAPRCPLGCGERVRPRFIVRHYSIDHVGEQRP